MTEFVKTFLMSTRLIRGGRKLEKYTPESIGEGWNHHTNVKFQTTSIESN